MIVNLKLKLTISDPKVFQVFLAHTVLCFNAIFRSFSSRHRGTVIEVFEGTSVSIALDDGKTKSFELGKQGIRFVSQKQKH